jgi:hypothetical protein
MNLLMGVDADNNDTGRTQLLIERADLDPSFNETTGEHDLTHTTIYSGAGIFFPVLFRRSRQELISEESARIRVYRALIPWDASPLALKDRVQVTTSSDADLVDRYFYIIDIMYETEQALRRFDVVDASTDNELAYYSSA